MNNINYDYIYGRAGMLDDPAGDEPAETTAETTSDTTEPNEHDTYNGDYIVHAQHGHVSFEALLGTSYEPQVLPDVVSWDDSELDRQQQAAKIEICGALESLLTLDYGEFKIAAEIWLSKLSIDGDNLSLTARKLHRTRQQIYRRLDKIFAKAPVLRFLVGDYEAARKADN